MYMHHNNNVGLTIAIQFGGARPTDLNFGGGDCPPCSASPDSDAFTAVLLITQTLRERIDKTLLIIGKKVQSPGEIFAWL